MKMCYICYCDVFFLLENTPNFEYGGEALASHKEQQVHMEKEKGGGKNRECL